MTSFLEKWSAKKSDKPKAGTRSAVDAFRVRVAEQKAYLVEFESDGAGFNKWRSTWFQRAPGGFGVTIGRDSIDAGQGLSYVVVETTAQVAEFLDDLAQHADNDVSFQKALEQNRLRRAALLNRAKAKVKAPAAKAATRKPATVKATETSQLSGEAGVEKPKRGRKPRA
ncbi:hypothetical protein [Rhizobium sp. BR 314]|uniref:hypothetical protein n=1 Tax=Rhizobium sp. BR 314 TaxID=3040013 RepID=UPI0039BF2188